MKRRILSVLINWYQSSDQPLPTWLERACRIDPALAREKAAGERLSRSLRQAPQRVEESRDSSFSAKVMRRITEEDVQAEASSDARGFAWIGAVAKLAAVAAMAVLLALAFQLRESPPASESDGAAMDSAPLASNGSGNESQPPAALPQIDPDLLRLDSNWENPLNKEIEYVISDAKGALGFLANSFVPKRYLEEERASSGSQGDDQA